MAHAKVDKDQSKSRHKASLKRHGVGPARTQTILKWQRLIPQFGFRWVQLSTIFVSNVSILLIVVNIGDLTAQQAYDQEKLENEQVSSLRYDLEEVIHFDVHIQSAHSLRNQ